MAGEITITSSVRVIKVPIDQNGIQVTNEKVDQSGSGYVGDTLTLAVGVDTVIPFTNLTVPGIWQVRHSGILGGTLDVGPESGGVIIPLDNLNTGEVAMGRIKSGVVLRVRALVAVIVAEFFIVED